jgi:type VI secretion system secreted protein VgrG
MPPAIIKINGEQRQYNHPEVTVVQELNSHWWCHVRLHHAGDQRFPAEEVLGKTIEISAQDTAGAENQIFTGIILESQLEYEIDGRYTARLTGVSKSYLLDLTPRREYFRQQSAKDVVQKLLSDAGLNLEGNMPAGQARGYHQMEETDFSFIARLADDAEAWMRPTEKGIEIQTAFQKAIELQWRGEDGLLQFKVSGRLSQPSSSGAHYDPKAMESKVFSKVGDEPTFYESSKKMVDAAKNQSTALMPPDYIYQRSRTGTIDEFQDLLKKESRRSLSRTVVCSGESRTPQLKPGNEVKINGVLDAQGVYGITRVMHEWTTTGYLNSFECTPYKKWTVPHAPQVQRYPGVVPARVVSNDDPDNSGRIQVQFYWQEANQTQWMSMMAPHAGANRGFMFLPEIGDEVWVAFEEGDPERGRVLGSAWNGVDKPPRDEFWGDDVGPNDVKRIVTKSGHRITIVDKPGKNSIVLATPKHLKVSLIENSDETGDAMLALHSDGDICLSAPNGRIHFHSKFFSREVGS